MALAAPRHRGPEPDGLMKDAHHGELNLVACCRFDRFARSVRHPVIALDDFRARCIDFISMHDGIDPSTAAGRLSFTLIAAVAELERKLIRERNKVGLQAPQKAWREAHRALLAVSQSSPVVACSGGSMRSGGPRNRWCDSVHARRVWTLSNKYLYVIVSAVDLIELIDKPIEALKDRFAMRL
ncbi:recombinase family protein [Sorangium sp. So ce448]|uniref:recombinase family protein n=1 Tax=Sorangium sp. So ce448 TaxID=3133314 RepID=UPI003F62B01A